MATEALTFDSLGTSRRKRGCPLCGEKNTVAVMVQIRRLDENGQRRDQSGDTKSASRSFCETHGVEAYLSLSNQVTP